MKESLRNLFIENPMQIETVRALRRFTVAGGSATVPRHMSRIFFGLVSGLYLWLLFAILAYREDTSLGILWFEFVMLTLLVPGSLYASISGERERLTWDSLILTRLSPAKILVGKICWRLGMALCFQLLCAAPLVLTHAATKFQTQYTWDMLLRVQFALTAWAVFLATFTLWVSASTRRSAISLSIVTTCLFGFLILMPFLLAVFSINVELDYYGPTVIEWLGSFVWHLHPVSLMHGLTSEGQPPTDRWRDLFVPLSIDRVTGKYTPAVGIYDLVPWIYLTLAGLCIVATLKNLTRLGMPNGKER
ncbi:MAG: ABC transporter permease subunit [Capsulimonadales bacterium]|nr:ABC transporter permease subunit [Capsulimonadales bacterium]